MAAEDGAWCVCGISASGRRRIAQARKLLGRRLGRAMLGVTLLCPLIFLALRDPIPSFEVRATRKRDRLTALKQWRVNGLDAIAASAARNVSAGTIEWSEPLRQAIVLQRRYAVEEKAAFDDPRYVNPRTEPTTPNYKMCETCPKVEVTYPDKAHAVMAWHPQPVASAAPPAPEATALVFHHVLPDFLCKDLWRMSGKMPWRSRTDLIRMCAGHESCLSVSYNLMTRKLLVCTRLNADFSHFDIGTSFKTEKDHGWSTVILGSCAVHPQRRDCRRDHYPPARYEEFVRSACDATPGTAYAKSPWTQIPVCEDRPVTPRNLQCAPVESTFSVAIGADDNRGVEPFRLLNCAAVSSSEDQLVCRFTNNTKCHQAASYAYFDAFSAAPKLSAVVIHVAGRTRAITLKAAIDRIVDPRGSFGFSGYEDWARGMISTRQLGFSSWGLEDPKYIGKDDEGRHLIVVVLPRGDRLLSLLVVYDAAADEVRRSCLLNQPGEKLLKNVNGVHQGGSVYMIQNFEQRAGIVTDLRTCDTRTSTFVVHAPPAHLALLASKNGAVHSMWRVTSIDGAGGILKLHRKNRFTATYTHVVCSFTFAHPTMFISACSPIFEAPASANALASAQQVWDDGAPSLQLDQTRYVSSVTAVGDDELLMSVNYGDCMQLNCRVRRSELGM